MELKRVYRLEHYCCLDLVRAVEDGYLTEVISGILVSTDTGSSKPFAKHCPFCGTQIKYTGKDGNHSWTARF